MSTGRGLLILGFGGHARSVADVALAAGYKDLMFLDDNAKDGETFLGFPVLRDFAGALPNGWDSFSAAGDNKKRQEQITRIKRMDWPLASLISPHATVGYGAQIAEGCLVAHHAHVGPDAQVGAGCIINTSAVIEHECRVGSFSHISVNATIAGRAFIGEKVFIGAGAVVVDGISICDDVVVGAGGVVIADIPYSGIYVGVPVRMLPK